MSFAPGRIPQFGAKQGAFLLARKDVWKYLPLTGKSPNPEVLVID